MRTLLLELRSRLDDLTTGLPQTSVRRMFGCDAFLAGGAIFAMVWREGRIGLRLPDDLLPELRALPARTPGVTGTWWCGRVLVPESFHDDSDGLASWDGRSEQVPCRGHAILFGRSIAAVLPDDLPVPLALAVMDVCGAPALTHRVVSQSADRFGDAPGKGPVVAILGAAGKSGSLSAAAARRAARPRGHRPRALGHPRHEIVRTTDPSACPAVR
jgi:TfoX/Sxy family transcriptional regulator of competence genes